MSARFAGTLRVHPGNPRYLTDDSLRAVYLTGSHHWYVLQDHGRGDPPEPFPFGEYLDFMERHGHTFLRLWCLEEGFRQEADGTLVRVAPSPWERTGLARIADGGPAFDLTRLNERYLERLRERVIAASDRGIAVAVMLFDGWSIGKGPWSGHPLNRANNRNGIDGDPAGTGEGWKVHTLELPEVTEVQKRYVRGVVEAVNDLDNVLYEISNESKRLSLEWQYEMIEFLHALEHGMPKQHPVLMTHLRPAQNLALFASPADAVSPGEEETDGPYNIDPPAADGSKVSILDTDHLGGFWGTSTWVWKAFARGHNPIFMDSYHDMGWKRLMGTAFGSRQFGLPDDWQDAVRRAMGQTRRYAENMNLAAMVPAGYLSSTGYCLAHHREEYLVYQPQSGLFKVRLIGARGPFRVEWFDPGTDSAVDAGVVEGGAAVDFTPPFRGDAVLHLQRDARS